MPIKYLIDDNLFSGSYDSLRTAIGGYFDPPPATEFPTNQTPEDYFEPVINDAGPLTDEYGAEGIAAADYTITDPVSPRLKWALSRTGDSTGDYLAALSTPSKKTMMMNHKFTIRLIGDPDNVFSDEHWEKIIIGGQWGPDQIDGILKQGVVYDDHHTEVIYPVDMKLIKRLKQLDLSSRDSWPTGLLEQRGDLVTIRPEINHYVPYFQRHTDNLKSELTIPNAYLMTSMIRYASDAFSTPPAQYNKYSPNYWNYDFIRSVARERVEDEVDYYEVNSAELFYDFSAGADPGYVSPYDALSSDMSPTSYAQERLDRKYSYMTTKYLPLIYPSNPLSSSTEEVIWNGMQNIIFDQYCGRGFDSEGSPEATDSVMPMVSDDKKEYFPYYINLDFYSERANIFTNRINFHSYSSKFLKLLKEVFLDEIALKPQKVPYQCMYPNVDVSYDKREVYEDYVREEKMIRTVDLMEFLLYSYNNYKSETDNCFFVGNPLSNPESLSGLDGFAAFQRKAAMDETGDLRYFNTLTTYDMIHTTMKLFGFDSSRSPEEFINSIDQLYNCSGDFLMSEFLSDPDADAATPETYGELGDMRGLRASTDGTSHRTDAITDPIFGYNEVVAYRVEKIASDDTGETLDAKPIQNFWFINTEDRRDINLVDTQIKYDKNYTYNIYSYSVCVGLKYKVDDVAISKYTSDVADDPDTPEDESLLHCLEFFDPETGEPTPEIFGRLDESELLEEMSGEAPDGTTTYFLSRASVRTHARYLADFNLTYEPSIKIKENKIYSKTLKALDHPANRVDIEPYQVLDQSHTIGFRVSYEPYIPLEYPQIITEKDLNIKGDYTNANDFLEGELITGLGDSFGGPSHAAWSTQKNPNESISRPRYLEVYRMTERPTQYEDFQSNLYKVVDLKIPNQKTATYSDQTVESEFFHDKIEYNRKYYYAFRILSELEMPGHISEIYESELVYDGNSPYAVFNALFKEDLKTEVFVNPTRSFKKLFQIRPNLQQVDFNDEDVDYSNRAIEEIANLGVGADVEETIWGERFKIRLTSKKTSKKIDLNVTFNLKSD